MIFTRAVKDTLSGQIAAFFVLVVGAGISLLYLYATESPAVAFEEIPYVTGAVLGAIGAFSLLFIWNLICAPYRIERDAHLKTQARLSEIENRLPQKQTRRLDGEKKGFLTSAIKHSGVRPESLNVLYSSTSEESADFAADIGDAIKSSGIKCVVHNGAMFNHNVRDRGLKIIYGKGKVLQAFSLTLEEAFQDIGYLAERRHSDETSGVSIYVARNAQE